MHLRELYQSSNKGFDISIEIFPPKTPQGEAGLKATLQNLSRFQPVFVSCTYGAGGSTRQRTLDWCSYIINECQLTATAHFTCVGSTRTQLEEWLQLAAEKQVQNIMALRGDPPEGQDSFEAVEGGFQHANELVDLIHHQFPTFGVGVAGYPEKHPEAIDLQTDLEHLKRKIDAGADAVFTQLFYVNDQFLSFRDRCTQIGIEVPVIPGIMPITEFQRIARITSLCGTEFPLDLKSRLESVQDDANAQKEIGIEYAIRQCEELRSAGVPGVHFYVLNKSQACEHILTGLGIEADNV